MAKIDKFTKDNLSLVRAKLNAAISAVENELGIKVDLGNITYDRDGTNFKCQLTAVAGQVAVDPRFADVPAQYIRDLKRHKGEKAFGKIVKIGGHEAVIVGMKASSYIFKYVEGSPMAMRSPGLRRIKFTRMDMLDCQVTDTEFDAHTAAIFQVR